MGSIRESREAGRNGGACGKWRAALALRGDRTEGNGGLCVLTGYVYAALYRHWRGTETWPCSGH